MRKLLMLTSASLIAISTSAMAAYTSPFIAPAPELAAPAQTFSWAGPYFGVDVGYGQAEAKLSADTSLISGSITEDFEGAVISTFAGYNWELYSGFMAGIEADLSFNYNDNKYRDPDSLEVLKLGSKGSGSVRAKTGFAVDKAYYFVTAGWAATSLHGELAGEDDKVRLNGYTVGAGVDYAVTNDVFVRGEYRFNDYGSKDILNIPSESIRIGLDQHIFKVGFGMKF